MSFIELALDFEEYAERTLPVAKFQGHTLPLQEGARVLRLALCTLQKLVKTLSTPPKSSRVPRHWCHWAARLWRVSIDARISHAMAPCINTSSVYLPIASLHGHYAHTHAPYVYCHRRCEQEVEEAPLQRALTGSLNTGLMPSSSLCAKGGAGWANFAGDFYPIMGGGAKSPKPPT